MVGTAQLALGKTSESASLAAASEPLRYDYLSHERSDQRRAETRVVLGEDYTRWTHIKHLNGIKHKRKR